MRVVVGWLRPDSQFAFQGQLRETHRTHRTQGIIFADGRKPQLVTSQSRRSFLVVPKALAIAYLSVVSRSPDEIRAGITLVFFLLLHGCYEGFPL